MDRRMFLKAMAAATAAAACGGGAGTGSGATAAPASATAARPTGRLSVYSALNESTNNAFVAAAGLAVAAGAAGCPPPEGAHADATSPTMITNWKTNRMATPHSSGVFVGRTVPVRPPG